jgi:hypothetical protein
MSYSDKYRFICSYDHAVKVCAATAIRMSAAAATEVDLRELKYLLELSKHLAMKEAVTALRDAMDAAQPQSSDEAMNVLFEAILACDKSSRPSNIREACLSMFESILTKMDSVASSTEDGNACINVVIDECLDFEAIELENERLAKAAIAKAAVKAVLAKAAAKAARAC